MLYNKREGRWGGEYKKVIQKKREKIKKREEEKNIKKDFKKGKKKILKIKK